MHKRLPVQGLGTPRAQVWEARMGESLLEYASPAVDLSTINDRLRAVRPFTPMHCSPQASACLLFLVMLDMALSHPCCM